MLKNLNSKRRLQLLMIAVVLAIILVYSFAISETIELVSACSNKEKTLAQTNQLEDKVAQLRAELKKIEGSNMTGDTSRKVIDAVLDHITNYCSANRCVVREIPPPSYAERNGYEVKTYFITLEGAYKDLLRLVYELEQKKHTGGHMASLVFQAFKNTRTKKNELHATLYIQHFKKTS